MRSYLICCIVIFGLAGGATAQEATKNFRLVDAQEIAEAVKAKAVSQMPNADYAVKVNPLGRNLVTDAANPNGVEIGNLNINKANNFFTATAWAPDYPSQKVALTGRITAMVKVPVLNTQRGVGETIEPSDIAWMEIEESALGAKPITNADQLIGKQAERLITPQTVIQSSMVKLPIIVRKNSLVTITYESGSMLITNQVRALENGAMGDVVRVQNSQSNRVVDAVVVGPDNVKTGISSKNMAMK